MDLAVGDRDRARDPIRCCIRKSASRGGKKLRAGVLARGRGLHGGLAQLKPLRSLRKLVLTSTGVTDAGMKHLAAMEGLTRLELGGTNVKPAAVEELKSKLKDVRINR